MLTVLFFLSLLFISSRGLQVAVSVRRLSKSPILGGNSSDCPYRACFNPALLLPRGDLLVRASLPRRADGFIPSALAVARRLAPAAYAQYAAVSPSPVFKAHVPYATMAVEDPRVSLVANGTQQLMFYSSVSNGTKNRISCRLSVALSNDSSGTTWNDYGPIFVDDKTGFQFTKSGAFAAASTVPDRARLIYGDSSVVAGLQLAYNTAPGVYTRGWQVAQGGRVVFPVRNESFFDSSLVESGPPPLRLRNGLLLFVYNSARKKTTSGSGISNNLRDNGLQYNVGFALLNDSNSDLSQIEVVHRSAAPILSPQLPWERSGDVNDVVFVEAMQQVTDTQFILYYGAADTNIGAAMLTIHVK